MNVLRVLTNHGSPLDVVVEVLGWHSGQMDMRMRASVDGVPVALLSYCVWNGEPSISMLEVSPDSRRRGIASAMLQVLQREHPGREICWGMLTPDGAALRASIPFVEIRDAARDASAERLARLIRETAEAETFLTAAMRPGIDLQSHAALLTQVEDLNKRHDEIRLLEAELERVPERVMLIRFCEENTSPPTPACPSA